MMARGAARWSWVTVDMGVGGRVRRELGYIVCSSGGCTGVDRLVSCMRTGMEITECKLHHISQLHISGRQIMYTSVITAVSTIYHQFKC